MASILLQASGEAQTFPVSIEAAKELSGTLRTFLSAGQSNAAEPTILPTQYSAATLAKLVEYCEHKHNHPEEEAGGEMSEWDKAFCAVDNGLLFDVILAANYFDIKPLLDVTCRAVSGMIKGKSPEEIRAKFNIKNDFTPEEEEQVRRENEWCEER